MRKLGNRRVPNGTHGGVRGRDFYSEIPPTRLLLKSSLTKKQSAALRAEALTYFFSPSGHDRKARQDGRRNGPPWKGVGLFSSQKKGKWLYRDEI